jgi:hypothetical protein
MLAAIRFLVVQKGAATAAGMGMVIHYLGLAENLRSNPSDYEPERGWRVS